MSSSKTALHVGPGQQTMQDIKDAEAATIAADIKRFLAEGGKIQKLGHGARSPEKLSDMAAKGKQMKGMPKGVVLAPKNKRFRGTK